MEFLNILALRGPNYWSRRSVLEVWVDLGALKDSPSNTLPGLYERLYAALPSLYEHRCGIGEPGGFLLRLKDGTYAGHILEHLALELQSLAGTPVGFGKARETDTPGIYKVAVRYQEEAVGRAALFAARELLLASIQARPYDVGAAVRELKALVSDVALGPSTQCIVTAAQARNIPVQRLNEGSLVQLGHGAKARRVWTAETDGTGAVAESIAQDKELTKELLRRAGVPVPEGRVVTSAEDAWEAAGEVGLPVVVKPRDGNHGRAVFIELSERAQVEAAYAEAREEGSGVLVERFVPGNEHRLLVVGGRVVAAARGETAYVTGDGEHSVEALIALQLNSDPRRGDGDECPLNPVCIDRVTRADLERQGLSPTAVPAAGVRVLIQRNGNVAFDCTDEVHPRVAEQVALAARVVGLDIAGIDLVAQDISRPLEEQGGALVEVNAGPGLHPHLRPAVGTPRPVGEAIVEALFAPGQDGRIPTVCVTGTNGKTVVTRLVAHLLRDGKTRVGVACSEGVFAGDRALERSDCAGPRSARRLLMNPGVDAAVVEAGRGGILREGLGFDRCHVAVVTNLQEPDHLGRSHINTVEQMYSVKRCPVDVVLPEGCAVLNAADPWVAKMAELSAGSVTFFAQDPSHPVHAEHRARGLRAVCVRQGQLVLAEGARETPVVALSELAFTRAGQVSFQVDNALAAAAAGWALGLSPEQLRERLCSFSAGREAPGRFQVFEAHGARVVVDDAHNPAALAAVLAALSGMPASRRTAVYSAGAFRRDEDLVRQGALLASHFDRVLLYQDASTLDRADGELFALLRQGLESAGRPLQLEELRTHAEAVSRALASVRPGELLLVQTEDAGTAAAVAAVQAWADRDFTRVAES